MSLRATNIDLFAGRKQILFDVSFDAEPGSLTAIVGPNGSGKSTLLKALTAESSYDGSIALNGKDIQSYHPWELATIRGVLPQATVLSFPFTVLEIIRLGLGAGPFANDPAIAQSALERVGLGGYAKRFYQELSGGEQQRVQLARVLAQVWQPVSDGVPRWLFLDEPVSSLDIAHQFTVMDIARDYAAQGGGVIAVMHDLNLTAMYADKIHVMSSGQTAASGSVVDVMTNRVLSDVYQCSLKVNMAPADGTLFILPQVARS